MTNCPILIAKFMSAFKESLRGCGNWLRVTDAAKQSEEIGEALKRSKLT
jgi:hypothetical protein